MKTQNRIRVLPKTITIFKIKLCFLKKIIIKSIIITIESTF